MKLICSDILPLSLNEGQQSISECFLGQAEKSDRIEIAVGYISKASLIELDRIVEEYNIKSICLDFFEEICYDGH